MLGIYSIVEGHGEERAVPKLFANILRNILGRESYFFWPPYRVSRGGISTINDEMTAALAAARVTIDRANGQGALFVILDSDDDCAVTLAKTVRTGIARLNFRHPVSVVACVREYESWFLIAASSLQGAANVRADAQNVANAEIIRNAKGKLERDILVVGRSYSPTVDQPEFSARIDAKQAMTSRSFRKLVKELDRAVAQ